MHQQLCTFAAVVLSFDKLDVYHVCSSCFCQEELLRRAFQNDMKIEKCLAIITALTITFWVVETIYTNASRNLCIILNIYVVLTFQQPEVSRCYFVVQD